MVKSIINNNNNNNNNNNSNNNNNKRTRVHKSINSRSLLFAKYMIFGKQKLDVKQLEDEQIIKYIWQLIISTSNATLEVPSLCPCIW